MEHKWILHKFSPTFAPHLTASPLQLPRWTAVKPAKKAAPAVTATVKNTGKT
jgi:hypothetical protein